MVVAFVNNKGGVGKTTSAVTIAAVLSEQQGPVLLIDLDSNASASVSLGIPRASLSPSMAHALLDGLPIERAIRTSGIPHLELLTGSLDLASTDVALAAVRNRERFLGSALAAVRDSYRHVIIDTPPSVSLLGINALAAADAFVVPVVPQALALDDVTSLLESVQRITRRLHLHLRLAGVLLTMVGRQSLTTAVGSVSDLLRAQLREQVFHTEIPFDPKAAEAPSFGRTVLAHAPGCPADDAYRRAAGELLYRLQAS